jgi:O-antigen ligase
MANLPKHPIREESTHMMMAKPLQPRWIIIIILGLVIVGINIVPHSYFNNLVIACAAVVFAAAFLVLAARDKHDAALIKEIPMYLKEIFYCLIAYCLIIVLALAASTEFYDSLRITVISLFCVSFAFIIYVAAKDKDSFHLLMTFISVSLFLTSLFNLYYFWQERSLGEGLHRLSSTMENTNIFAVFLIILVPICISYIINLKDALRRLIFSLMLVPALLCLVLTYTRAAYVAFFIIIVALILLINWKFLPIVFLGILVIIPFIPQPVVERLLSSGSDYSSTVRLEIWQASLVVIKNNWLAGVGSGPLAFEQTDLAAYDLPHSHNLFIQISLETGIFSLLAFVALVVTLLVRSLVAYFKTSRYNKVYLAGFIASLLGIMSFGVFDYVWFYPRALLAFWIMVGLFLGLLRLTKQELDQQADL